VHCGATTALRLYPEIRKNVTME